jgi:hypothetical protein
VPSKSFCFILKIIQIWIFKTVTVIALFVTHAPLAENQTQNSCCFSRVTVIAAVSPRGIEG